MNKRIKLVDLDASVRLLNVLGSVNVFYYDELQELYQRHIDKNDKFDFRQLRNMGLKSIKEIFDMMGGGFIEDQRKKYESYEDYLKEEKELRMKKQLDEMKKVVKLLHKNMFYDENVDIEKLSQLSSRLSKLVA